MPEASSRRSIAPPCCVSANPWPGGRSRSPSKPRASTTWCSSCITRKGARTFTSAQGASSPWTSRGGEALAYDADTQPGSSGGPIFNADGRVVGVHVRADPEKRLNLGASRTQILAALHGTSVWDEVAAWHRVADVTAASEALSARAPVSNGAPVNEALLRAAVRWSVEPSTLPEADARDVRPLIEDPDEVPWVLPEDERRRIIKSASWEALRRARGREPLPAPRQQAIDAILAGPPYDLDDRERVGDESLPYWLQAVRWFEGVAPLLPTAAAVARALERRRLRTRLAELARRGVRGRDDEIAEMHGWYDTPTPGPLMVWGVGGIGKSTLVASFAESLPKETVLVWLDFDRVDLAPDDAVSVLVAIRRQVSVQVDGIPEAPIARDSWRSAAEALGGRMAAALAGSPPPLLVLDSFEVAQHAERYQELWPVLDAIFERFPPLRVIVSGRAPVAVIAGRAATLLPLKGLRDKDAKEWLRERGVRDEAVLGDVVALAKGNPLVLTLALTFRARSNWPRHSTETRSPGGHFYPRRWTPSSRACSVHC